MKKRYGDIMREFFTETFRIHGKEEYAEVLTRGMKKDASRRNMVYPWLWARVLAALLFAFAVFSLIVCVLSYDAASLYTPTLYVVSGAFIDLAFLVALFELAPDNDISLIKLAFVALVGGGAACTLGALLWSVPDIRSWSEVGKAVYAGVAEELVKAIPTIVAIKLCKRRTPYTGFLIGAAVGTLFSLTENAGYIYSNSYDRLLMIGTAFARGGSGMVTHALWSGAIGYAFALSPRPFRSVKFYASVLLCMLLHSAWDMPLQPALLACVYAACALVGAMIGIYIIRSCRKSLDLHRLETEKYPIRFPSAAKRCLLAGGILTCLLVILLGGVFSLTTRLTYTFDSPEAFVLWAQGGRVLAPDMERAYDESAEAPDFTQHYNYGELTYAAQRVYVSTAPDTYFVYVYYVTRDENGEDTALALRDVYVQIADETGVNYTTYIMAHFAAVRDGEQFDYAFFPIKPECSGASLSTEDGKVVCTTRTRIFRPSVATVGVGIACIAVPLLTVLAAIFARTLEKKKARTENTDKGEGNSEDKVD